MKPPSDYATGRLEKRSFMKRYEYDCVIVGGGAAGMTAAAAAAERGANTAVIEHTRRLGSKLLKTGNGKCNFTNLEMSGKCYQNDDTEFVMNVINKFDENSVIDFFKKLGVYPKSKNGYIYPHSETAASLQDALRMELDRLDVRVFLRSEIIGITKTNNEKFIIDAIMSEEPSDDAGNKNKDLIKSKIQICCGKLIIAAGSCAAPATGSDGSGYRLAESFGHKIIKPLPALVQLVSSFAYCRAMSGVRSTGKIKLYIESEEVCSDTGEIQYTDYGISGIPVFQVSRYAVRGVDSGKSVKAVIDMLPDIPQEELENDIDIRILREPSKSVEQFFAGIINKKLVYGAAKSMGIDINMHIGQLGGKRTKKLVRFLKNFEFEITGFKGFENCQVCQGGVALSQLDSDTMQSRLCGGLYFAGEIADVDGKCGGYNLQWAWSSGITAGRAAAQSAVEDLQK